MAVERQVIAANIKKVKVKEFLRKNLEKAGIGEIDIQRTPMDTRVIIHAQRPGIVIGKKGTTIKSLTDTLRNEYGLDEPQIEVNDLAVPELSAQVMARSIASSLERGYHFRRAAYSALRDIMKAGAIGVQITLSGKVTGERSRVEKFMDGYIKHCGEPSERLVLKGFAEAAPKLGRIGIKVKILPPGSKMPDNITIRPKEKPVEEPKPIEPEAVETKKTEPGEKPEVKPKKKKTTSKPAEKPVTKKDEVKKKVEKEAPKKQKPKVEKPVKEAVKPKKAKAEKTKGKKPVKEKDRKKPKDLKVKKEPAKAEPKSENLLDKPSKDLLKALKGSDKKKLPALLKEEKDGKKRKTVIAGIEKLLTK